MYLINLYMRKSSGPGFHFASDRLVLKTFPWKTIEFQYDLTTWVESKIDISIYIVPSREVYLITKLTEINMTKPIIAHIETAETALSCFMMQPFYTSLSTVLF